MVATLQKKPPTKLSTSKNQVQKGKSIIKKSVSKNSVISTVKTTITKKAQKSIISKAILVKALQNFNHNNKKKYLTCLKALNFDDEAGIQTDKPVEPKYLNRSGQMPEWIRGRSCHDKTSKPFESLIPCPYKLCNSWFATWSENRLTVYSDDLFDGQFRPQYTFYNIDVIPLKSQVDVYAKYVQKKQCISASDWLGNEEEVQLIIGDVSGYVYRCDLQQRITQNNFLPFGEGVKIVSIRTHYDTNVFAVLGENNEIKVYTCVELWDYVEPVCVAHCKIKPDVVDIFWCGGKLYAITKDELISVTLNSCEKLNKKTGLKKPENVGWEILFTSKNKISKYAKVKVVDDEHVLAQRLDGTLEEVNVEKKKITKTLENPLFNIDYDYALHANKRIIACGGADGDLSLVEYKTGKTVQRIKKRGNGVGGSTNIFWSLSHKDNILLTFGNRVVRYNPKYDRLVSSKPAELKAFFNTTEKELGFCVRADSMDQTNIDHDHRAYQWHWGHDENSEKKTDFTTGRGKRLQKILKHDDLYEQYLMGHKNSVKNKGSQDLHHAFQLKKTIVEEIETKINQDTETSVGKRKHSPEKVDRKKHKTKTQIEEY